MALNFVLLIIFSLSFLGIGEKILLGIFGRNKFDFPEKFLFSLGLGIGVFEILALILGFFELLEARFFGVILFLILLFTAKNWGKTVGQIFQRLREIDNWAFPSKILIFLIFIRVLFNFLIAQSPPTEGDALWHHLTTPKIFIRHQGIIDTYFLPSYLSLGTEMIYLWGMILKDEILAQNLNFLVGSVFMTFGVYFFCQKFFSKKLALLAAFVFIFTPLVSWEGVSPTVDLFWSFFVLLAFWAMLRQWHLLGFIFIGLSFATKSVLGVLPLFGLLPFLWKKISLGSFFKAGLIAFLLWLPYLLRSFLLTGNPIYPLLPQIFGGGGLEVKALVSLSAQFYEKSLPFWDFFTYWWRVSMFPQKFGPDVGPLYIVFAPVGLILLGLLYFKPHRLTIFSFLFCFLFYAFWYFFSVHTIRYLLPIFPFLAILVAGTVRYLIKAGGLVKFLTLAILVLFVPMSFLTYFWSFERYAPKLRYSLGLMGKEEYLFKALPYTSDFFWINQNLPSNAKVLLFLSFQMRPFYLDREFILGSILQREIDFSRPEEIKNEEEFLGLLKKNGVTHIFAAPSLTLAQDQHLEKFRRALPEMEGASLIYQGISGDAYEILR